MNIFYMFDILNEREPLSWSRQFWQGVLLILFGIAIVIVPQLLVALIASFFIVAGILVIGAAWTLKRMRRQYQGFKNQFYDIV